MSRRIVASALAMVAWLVVSPATAADPTKVQCIAANDAAQELRQAGKLRQAREKLVLCMSHGCPGPVREDCAQRLTELDAAMPSLVFEVKDRNGNDASAVRVTVDGQPFADKLDGSGLQVDPGEHRFAFDDADGHTHAERTVVVHEGDRNRHERITLGDPLATSSAASPTAANPSDWFTQQRIGLVVAGGGAVGLVLGSVFGIVAKSTYDGAHCPTCSGATVPQAAYDQATGATVSFIVGGVLAAGGAVLYFTAPKAGGLAVAPSTGGAGLSLKGTW
jgi:hypothetical protein